MSYIPDVTAENVSEIPFNEMMRGLRSYVLEEVPEGTNADPEVLQDIDRLIGRFANLYSYLIYLYAVVANEANRLKLIDAGESYKLMVRKKDALYELARAVRYKHQACSRMLTAYQEEESPSHPPFDRADYQGREKRQKERRQVKGWNHVS